MNIKQINNKKIYDENWADWLEMKVHGPASRWLLFLIKDILRDIDKREIKSILDVGCGEGTLTYEIANLFSQATVTGIDFSKSGIKLGRNNYRRNNLKFQYDLNSNLLNRRYDLLTAFEVLEHVRDWETLLRKMARSSRHYVLLSFPTGRMRSFEKNVGHLRNFRKGEVEQVMETEGFMARHLYYAGFPFFSPLYRELCNITNSANNTFTKRKNYNLSQKFVSNLMFFLFRFGSTKLNYGEQFCGLFERSDNGINKTSK